MNKSAKIKFLSLFVPNLAEAVDTYRSLLGLAPQPSEGIAPGPHPFGAKGPIVFQLGDVALALYECDGQTTHAGDVGIGLETDIERAASSLREHGGRVFWGPAPIGAGQRRLAIGVSSDRHFFEIVEPVTGE